MNRLKRGLDNNSWNRDIEINKIYQKDRKKVMNMVSLINNNYSVNIPDPSIMNSVPIINVPKRLIFKKEKIIVDRPINSVGDLF